MGKLGGSKRALFPIVATLAILLSVALWIVTEIPVWGRLAFYVMSLPQFAYVPTFLALCVLIAMLVDYRRGRLPKWVSLFPIIAFIGYYGTFASQTVVISVAESRLSDVNAKTRFSFDPSRDSLFTNYEEVLIDLDVDRVFKRSNRVSTRAEFGLVSDEICADPNKAARSAGLSFERIYKRDGRTPLILGGGRKYPAICSVELRGDAPGRPILVIGTPFYGKASRSKFPPMTMPVERPIAAISPDGVVGLYVTAEIMRLPILPLPRFVCDHNLNCGVSIGEYPEELDTRPAGLDARLFPEPENVLLSITARPARSAEADMALLSRMTTEAISRKDPANIEAAYRFVLDPTAEVPSVSDGTFLTTIRAARQRSRGSAFEQGAYAQAMVSKFRSVLEGRIMPERADIARRGLGLALEDLLDSEFAKVSDQVFASLVNRNDRSHTEDRLFARTAAFTSNPQPYYDAYMAKADRPISAFAETAAMDILCASLPDHLKAIVKRNALSLIDVLSVSGQAHVSLVSGVWWRGDNARLSALPEDKKMERRKKRYEEIFAHALPFERYRDTRLQEFRDSYQFRRLTE